MPDRKIKHLSFRYTDDGVEKHAFQGETVDLPADEAKRGDSIGAFVTDTDPVEESTFDPGSASDDELREWIENDKPTAQQVLDVANDNPELASRLLAAENAATGNDPRKTVIAGLESVAGRAQ